MKLRWFGSAGVASSSSLKAPRPPPKTKSAALFGRESRTIWIEPGTRLVPVPDNAAVSGEPGASEVTWRLALLAPMVVGAKVTSMVQLSPGASVVPEQVSLAEPNWPGLVPLVATVLMFRSALPLSVQVTHLAIRRDGHANGVETARGKIEHRCKAGALDRCRGRGAKVECNRAAPACGLSAKRHTQTRTEARDTPAGQIESMVDRSRERAVRAAVSGPPERANPYAFDNV